jgi:Cu+-exporting ATPase
VALASSTGFASLPGKGVIGTVDGRAIALGNRALMEQLGVDVGAVAGRVEELRAQGQTVMYLAVDQVLAGLIGVMDPIKESSVEAIGLLQRDGSASCRCCGATAPAPASCSGSPRRW